MKTPSKKIAYSLLSVGIALLFVFTNCSDVRLVSAINTISQSSLLSGLLNPPKDVRAHTRLVFVVDHSFSMVYDGCADDLDGTNPKAQPGPCQPGPGEDVTAQRYEIIANWLFDIKSRGEPDVKVLVLPFSGGIMDDARIRNESEKLEFVGIDAAVDNLNAIRDEQVRERANPNLPLHKKRMGTSVPFRFLSLAKAKIQEEMIRLLRAKELFSTAFEFYLISDGKYKPTRDHIQKALELANCPVECVMDPELVRCDNMVDATHFVGNITPEVRGTLSPDQKERFEICKTSSRACACLAYGTVLHEYFGQHENNDPSRVRTQLVTISELATYFGEGDLKMKFVRVIDPGSSPAHPPDDEFAAYAALIPGSQIVDLRDMRTLPPQPAPTLKNVSFKIDDFYAVNLNAIPDESGRWLADSDMDGLTDAREVALGLDPLNPRSGIDDHGSCLDGLRVQYGCRTVGCDAAVDRDGDGLNDCEELTLGTNSTRRDTSGDGIFDYLKVLKGFGPLIDARDADSNSDSFTDQVAFKFGLSPTVDARAMPAAQKIEARVDFLGFKDAGGGGTVPSYRVTVDNLPLVATLPTGPFPKLHFDRLRLDPIEKFESVGAYGQSRGVNQVVFLARARSLENKDLAYWLLWRGEIDYRARNHLELDLSEFQELRKIGWGF